ncbi:MAG: DNA repair protein RecN [Rhabdochlamydiaceae bacterium]|nr:DNA repair protein RecN [Rhabdochlamydiaceae bacterium]
MIKSLHLNNLVLVDSCELEFQSNFTALTGETGAGKTALTEAIHLALGARADTSLIRTGADKASVEISFSIRDVPKAQALLSEAGIDFSIEEELIIRREISREGKNRAFLNCQMVPLPLLQKTGATLLELIGQHTHQGLLTSDFQRSIVDLFGDLFVPLKAFQEAWEFEKQLKKTLDTLLIAESKREKEEENLRLQLNEILEAQLKEGEEEQIIEEHKRLYHAQEINEKTQGLLHTFSTVLPQVNRSAKICEALISLDPSFQEPHTLVAQALIALNEAQHELQRALNRIENDPNRFHFLEERLAAIHRIKRKYGQDIHAIFALEQQLKTKLASFDSLSESIEETKAALAKASTQTTSFASKLSSLRRSSALVLEQELTKELHSLNMPSAQIKIEISPHARTAMGDDQIDFWIRANKGEEPVLVKEHASGGELSRLLFAIKITLAEKNDTPTLIFDEIDANVGGTTASIIGEKLRSLGTKRQVICITHFPQVASQANAQISVQKIEKDGRTLTQVLLLDPKEREKELLRMLGGTPQLYRY